MLLQHVDGIVGLIPDFYLLIFEDLVCLFCQQKCLNIFVHLPLFGVEYSELPIKCQFPLIELGSRASPNIAYILVATNPRISYVP